MSDGPRFPHVREPCRACPWRADAHAADIPGFAIELAEALAATCPDARGMGPHVGAPMFACHQSKEQHPFACAGWLAVAGHAHPGVRLAVRAGRLSDAALAASPGWPTLHASFDEMISKLRYDSHEEAQ